MSGATSWKARRCRRDNSLVPSPPLQPGCDAYSHTTVHVSNPTSSFDQKSDLVVAFLYPLSIFHFPKSIPNPDAIMPSNRAGSYDHNGTTFNSVPILEAEIRKLPFICLHIVSQQPLRVRTRTISRSKGLTWEIQTQLRLWKSVQGKWRYSSRKLEVLS